MTTTNWTNPETGKMMTVFVHAAYNDGEQVWLKVNKGANKGASVFAVLADDTDYTPSPSVFS
jgi:hypothetical protein